MDHSANSLSGSLKRMGEVAGGVFIAQMGGQLLSGIKNAAGAILDFSSQTEQAAVSFRVMTGSAEAGAAVLRDLEKFALTTPFDFPDVLELSKRLLAAGTSTENLIPTMTMLGNVAAGVGKEKLPQLILAFGQVQAAGKLTGAELRQFTEASAFGLTDLAKHFNVTTAEAKKMVEEGKVGFKDVRDILAQMSNEGGKFHNLMGDLSRTFGGAMANVRDALRFASRDMFAPLFEQMSKWAQALAGFLQTEDFKAWAKDAGRAIAEFAGWLEQATTVMFNFAVWVSENSALLTALRIAAMGAGLAILIMNAPMIGLAILIGTVIAAIAVMIDHWSLFEQAAGIVGHLAGQLAQTLADTLGKALGWLADRTLDATQFMIDRFRTLAQAVAIVGKALGQDVSGLVSFINTIPTSMKGAFSGVPNFISGVGNAIGGTIDGLKANVGTAFIDIASGAMGAMTNLLKPIQLVGATVEQAAIKFTDGPDSLGEKAKAGAAGVDKAMKDAAKSAKELEDAIVKRAEAMGKALMNALGTGTGETLGRLQQGFDDFAKAEWVTTLETEINAVSRRIQEALAMGLDPTPIVQAAMPLFDAYAAAMDKTAETVKKAAEELKKAMADISQKAIEMGERIGAEGKKAAENQIEAFGRLRSALQSEQENISKGWLENLKFQSSESVRIANEALQQMVADGRAAGAAVQAEEEAYARRKAGELEGMQRSAEQQRVTGSLVTARTFFSNQGVDVFDQGQDTEG